MAKGLSSFDRLRMRGEGGVLAIGLSSFDSLRMRGEGGVLPKGLSSRDRLRMRGEGGVLVIGLSSSDKLRMRRWSGCIGDRYLILSLSKDVADKGCASADGAEFVIPGSRFVRSGMTCGGRYPTTFHTPDFCSQTVICSTRLSSLVSILDSRLRQRSP